MTNKAQPETNLPSRRFFVTEIEVVASIGIYDHERKNKQRVVIDVEVVLDPRTEPRTDIIGDGLDYDMIRDSVMAITGARHFDLQETLARALFDKMLSLPEVIQASVRTSKPDIYDNCKEAAYQLSNIQR